MDGLGASQIAIGLNVLTSEIVLGMIGFNGIRFLLLHNTIKIDDLHSQLFGTAKEEK